MTEAAANPTPSKPLGWGFWMLCTMEMWERLAYFGVRVVVPIYIAQADEPGGLHLTQADKGFIYFWWFIFQSILPSFTGGFADRYGYKKTIFWSIVLKIIGYVMMGTLRSYWGFFAGTMMLATGTAVFKPGIQGSLAQSLDKGNASKGWGVFYWLVNVGGLIGPPLAGYLHGWGWDWVFFGCAAIVSLNFLMLFTYEEVDSGHQGHQDPFEVMKTTLLNLGQPRLLLWLLLMSGFWLMMYQLWDLHPNFITDWIDSSAVAASLPLPESWMHMTDRGMQVKQENLINLNAALIVLFMVPISILVAKMRTLVAMVWGMSVAICGILVSGNFQSGWIFLLGVALFSFGEMLTGPKKQEYLGLIAPPGKKALYLGYVNIPVGIGGAFGAALAGALYGSYGEKAILAQKYLAEHTDFLGAEKWDGDLSSLEEVLGITRSQAFTTLVEHLGSNGTEVTQLLWVTYQPYLVWWPIAAIGLASTIGLVIYARLAKNWKDMDV